MRRLIYILLATGALSGCSTLGYYGQAVSGHFSVLNRARPITDLIEDPGTSPTLKTRLQRVVTMRDFASRELGLPDNESYRRYADLERPYVVWNVFATPALALKPKRWCYLVAGCFSYRGYFDKADAENEAAALRADGHDVYVGGVPAYSTLGWFDDPLLNTMMSRSEVELAGTLFHELAHQKLHIANDTAFNESFAMTIEREGVRRWLAAQGTPADYTAYVERNKRHETFIALLMSYRKRLEAMYDSPQSDDSKRADKRALLNELRVDYERLKKSEWNGYTGFDRWMEDMNNAKFISIGLYNQYVPAFERLLAQHGNDLKAFYEAARALANASPEQRLASLSSDSLTSR